MNTEATTLPLPSDRLAAADKLAELRRSALDAEFLHMADDVDYLRDVYQLLGEFAQGDYDEG